MPKLTPTECKRCKASVIFIPTKNGKQMPILASSYTEGDTIFDHTKHKSHFADCPGATDFRKAR